MTQIIPTGTPIVVDGRFGADPVKDGYAHIMLHDLRVTGQRPVILTTRWFDGSFSTYTWKAEPSDQIDVLQLSPDGTKFET